MMGGVEKTARQRWEEFKLEWMLDHGCSISDLIWELNELQKEMEPGASIEDIYAEWHQNVGFDSMIWPCFEEWRETDLLLSDY